MLTLLVQSSDERALRGYLDTPAYRQLAETTGVHVFLIDGASVTELTKADNHEHDRRAS